MIQFPLAVLLVCFVTACKTTSAPEASIPANTIVSAGNETLYIGPSLKPGVGVPPQQCFQAKKNPNDDYELLYEDIEGFDYEPGYNYQLKVRKNALYTAPTETPVYEYYLIEVVKKTPAK